jgi:spore coat polysaccharide biosynthesis protein SpsF
MNKVVGIIQARLGSTRLPNKMLLHLNGFAVVQWVVHRVTKSKSLDQLVAAIPEGIADDPLAEFLKHLPIEIIRGPEDDVLDRFHRAATVTKADYAVRICADNPLVSWEAIDLLVTRHIGSKKFDYTYNHVPKNNLWPDGLGAEICSISTLNDLHKNAKESTHREHLFNYLWDHVSLFQIDTFDPPFKVWQRPDIKLDIDNWDDYRRMQRLNYHPDMTIDEIIQKIGTPHYE